MHVNKARFFFYKKLPPTLHKVTSLQQSDWLRVSQYYSILQVQASLCIQSGVLSGGLDDTYQVLVAFGNK